MRQRPDGDLQEKPVVTEDLVLEQDLLDHVLRAADKIRAPARARRVEVLPCHRPPAALLPDLVHHLRERGECVVRGLLGRLCDVAVRIDAQRNLGGIVPGLGRCASVKLGERREPLRQAADDPECHGQPERAGADRRLGRAADRDPDRQRLVHRARIDAAVVERRPVPARPRHAFGFAQREQELELLAEQLVVVVEVVAEERERLDE